MSKVSVIVNCYNGEKFLKEAIDSIYVQTYQDFEIIFWDNNSTDKTKEIATSYDSKLRYFCSEKTVPLYHARNLALGKAQGEFIAILDADDVWLPNKLELQLPLFKDPKVGVVYADTYYLINGSLAGTRFQTVMPHRGNVFADLFSDYFVPLACIVLRRKAMESLEYGFDIRFQMIGDQDLMKRLAFCWEFDFVEKPLAKVRLHEGNLSKKYPRLFAQEGEVVLETYKKIFPNFETDYYDQMCSQIREIDYIYAKSDLMEGNVGLCRQRASRHLSHKNFITLYLLSLVPKFLRNSFVEIFQNLRRKFS